MTGKKSGVVLQARVKKEWIRSIWRRIEQTEINETNRKTTACSPNCSTSDCNSFNSVWPSCWLQSAHTVGSRRTLATCCSCRLSNDLASSTVRGSSLTPRISSVIDRRRDTVSLQPATKPLNLCSQLSALNNIFICNISSAFHRQCLFNHLADHMYLCRPFVSVWKTSCSQSPSLTLHWTTRSHTLDLSKCFDW